MNLWPFKRRPSVLQAILDGPETDDLSERSMDLILRSWTLFLRAGGAVDAETWGRIPVQVRAVMAVAGDRVALERAAAVGQAASGPVGLAKVTAPLDGGMALEEMAVDRLLEEAMAEDHQRSKEVISAAGPRRGRP